MTWGKRFEVATWSGQHEVTTRNGRRDLVGLATGGLASRPRFFGPRPGHSMRGTKAGRDLVLRSRLG